MAASSSREAHNIPLPPSPFPDKETKSTSRRKGKDKEQPSAGHKRRVSQKAADKGNADADLDWDWTALTDSHVSKVPPVFTKDGSYFFSLVGPSVKIYSVATGQNVSTLTPPRPSNAITGSNLLTSAVLNPNNAFQLITGSCNGYIHIWDFLEATLLKTIDLSQPVHHLCVHEKFKDYIFASVTRPSKNKTKGADDSGVVLKVSLHTKEAIGESSVRTSSEIVPIGKTRFPTGLAISHNGEWLVATAGHKAYVASLTSSPCRFTKFVSPERITCLAFHPSEDYFATGDAKGNIRLWYCLNDQVHVKAVGVEKKTQTASFHWHAHAVSSLVFTSNGAYLLSGGEEAVLVIWQLEGGKKEFIPRIGAPINTIALSKVGREEEYLVGLADGTYLFIGASTLQVSRSYSRIRLDPAVVHDGASTSTSVTPTPLASHPASSTLILPSSHPSSLQMFSLPSSQVISELEVSPSNRVSRRDEKPLEPSRVEFTVVSSSGDWMATVDRREGDGTLHGEVYLKIWSWDRQVGSWILNTRIDRPHGSQKVMDIAFSPVSPSSPSFLLATTGADNNIKLWRLKKTKDRTASEFWVPRSTFNFRSETPQKVSWSPDGSLLSISFKKLAVLYDPLTTVPRRILTTPECPNVSSAQFVGSSGRYLAIISGRDISIWDLVLQSVLWHRRTDFRIQSVISRPNDDSFTVLCHQGPNTHASVYSCSSSQPIMTRKLPFRLRSAIAYSSQFIGISQDWSVIHFGDDVQKAPDEGAAAIGIQASTSSTKSTLFQDIFGKSAFSGEQEAAPQPAQDLSRTDQIPSLFDGPSFMMPPLESLFDDVMSDFIKPRNVALVDTADGDGDIEMGDVDETEALPKPSRRNLDALDMDAFIGLFKQHSLQPRPQTNARPKPITNGSSKTNGHGHDRKRPAKPKTPTKSQAPPSSSPIALNGKKRKKVD